MRKKTMVALLSIGVLSALWLGRPGPASANPQDCRGVAAGHPFAGSFLAEFGGALEGVQCLVQMHADGTIWHIDQGDFGHSPFLRLDSAQVGSWRRTGPFQTTHVTLFLNFDLDGTPTTVTRVNNVADWEVGFDAASGLATLREYDVSLGEDPLDPEQGTPVPVEVPWTFRRIVP